MHGTAPPDTQADLRPSGSAARKWGSASRGSLGGAPHRAAGAWLAASLAAVLAVLAVQAHAQEAPAADAQEAPAADAVPVFEQILVAGESRYARSRRAGVHVSFDQGHTWQARSTGLPHRVVYPFPDPPEFATVTSLAADPADPRRLAATTASAVFVSSNGGMAWQPLATEQVHPHAYFTSVALSPHDPAGMLLGTSFHGVYETTDGGAHWHHLTPAIRFLTERNLYYEEVAGLSYDPAAPRAMVVLAGFDGGVFYVSDRFGEERRSGTGLLRYPVPAMATIQIGYAATGDGWELHGGTVDARWRLTADGTWSPIGAATALRRGVPLQLPVPTPAPVAIEAALDSGQSGTLPPDSGATKLSVLASGLLQAPPPATAQQPATELPAGEQPASEPAPAGQAASASEHSPVAPTAESTAAEQTAANPPSTDRTSGDQTSEAHTTAGQSTAHQAPATPPGAAPHGAPQSGSQPALAAGEPGWIPGPGGMATAAPHTRAALRNGIYVRADRAAAALPEYLELLNRHGLDSLVIDFKTDSGSLGYDSDLPLARAMGAAPGPIKLDRLIADAHAAGIYVIARLVVFKDPYLYDWDNHRLAIWDGERGEPWRHLVPAGGDDPDAKVQREYWVDPFAPEVWQYNVDVAVELASRGVDEIQFDYIRFPSDGPVERARYRHRRPGQQRIDAIESLLALARERLEVPISTDLFGFNSWYRAGNFIGQDIDVLSEYADVISPMFYPSHFPGHFMSDRSYTERAYAIYETGVRRAQRLVAGASPHPALRAGVSDRPRAAHGGGRVQPLPDAPARRQPGGRRLRVHPSGTRRIDTIWSPSRCNPTSTPEGRRLHDTAYCWRTTGVGGHRLAARRRLPAGELREQSRRPERRDHARRVFPARPGGRGGRRLRRRHGLVPGIPRALRRQSDSRTAESPAVGRIRDGIPAPQDGRRPHRRAAARRAARTLRDAGIGHLRTGAAHPGAARHRGTAARRRPCRGGWRRQLKRHRAAPR